MADERLTAGIGPAGFTGTCDDVPWYKFWDLGHGCTGTIPDDGKGYGNVATASQSAQSISDAQDANDALDRMGEAISGAAQPADADAAQRGVSALNDAFVAIATARRAIADGGPWSQQMSDAGAKTQIYLNVLTAGKVQLDFARGELVSDLLKPVKALGFDLSWLAWGAAAVVAAIILYKVAK